MNTTIDTFKKACLVTAALTLAACSQVPEGHVGLTHSRIDGKYSNELESRGNHLAILTGYDYLTAHQVLVDIKDIKPKDKNDVLLKDMDITVAFKINIKNPDKVVEFIRSTNDLVMSSADRSAVTVGTAILKREASSSAKKAMQAFSSQEALQNQDKLEEALKKQIQIDLDVKYQGVFEIESVITQTIQVSDAIEAKIQQTATVAAQDAQNAALETIMIGKTRLLTKEAQALADVAKITGVSVDQLLKHNLIKALDSNNDTKTVLNIPVADVSGPSK